MKNPYTVTVFLGPHAEWVAKLTWPEGETQGGPVALEIQPTVADEPPAGGLSQTVLREVDFRGALDKLRLRVEDAETGLSYSRNLKKVTSRLVEYAASGSVTDPYLALLSEAYV